ncbi:MAG: DsrE family protein [Anaerolineales bacterium]
MEQIPARKSFLRSLAWNEFNQKAGMMANEDSLIIANDETTVLACGADFKSVMLFACKASGCGFDSHSRLHDRFPIQRNRKDDMSDESSFANGVILITRDGMGSADLTLQHKLLDTYLNLLLENGSLPVAICFYTEGVKLVVEGSPLLERLSQIEQRDVRLIICSTCLNYFGLTEKVRVGIVGGMSDILEAQARAGKVITL